MVLLRDDGSLYHLPSCVICYYLDSFNTLFIVSGVIDVILDIVEFWIMSLWSVHFLATRIMIGSDYFNL